VHELLFFTIKIWTTGKLMRVRQMDAFFNLLRSGAIDLMQVHNLVDWKTHTAMVHAWKDQGRIRYMGMTHYITSACGEVEWVMR
jgi:diketogulonate reductase-like aldo/keto reductase